MKLQERRQDLWYGIPPSCGDRVGCSLRERVGCCISEPTGNVPGVWGMIMTRIATKISINISITITVVKQLRTQAIRRTTLTIIAIVIMIRRLTTKIQIMLIILPAIN